MTRRSKVEYETHPAAELFPLMSDEELAELAADIDANGLRCPVVVIGPKILDGRNRARACARLGIEPKFEQYEGPTDTRSLLDYAKSLNLARRHLTPSQRALVAARALPMYDAVARERQAHGKTAPGKTLGANLPEALGRAREGAGDEFGVSGRSVEHGKAVLANGTPELVRMVERGTLAVSVAADLAKQDERTQKRLLKKASGDGGVLRASIRALTQAPPARPKSTPRTTVVLDGDAGPEDICELCHGEELPPEEECRACGAIGPEAGPPDEARAFLAKLRGEEAGAFDRARDEELAAEGLESCPDCDGDVPPGGCETCEDDGAVPPPSKRGAVAEVVSGHRPWREVLCVDPGPWSATTVVEQHARLSEPIGVDHDELDRALAVALSQWHTQEREADLMAEIAGLAESETIPIVLEPSAGAGAIVQAVHRVRPDAHVVAYEIDSRRIEGLRELTDDVHEGDFLGVKKLPMPCTVAVANTPYEGGTDGRFLEHMMGLVPRIVALVRLNAMTGKDRRERVWSAVERGEWHLVELVILERRPGFDGPGEDGARSDYVIVHLQHDSVVAAERGRGMGAHGREPTVVRWA